MLEKDGETLIIQPVIGLNAMKFLSHPQVDKLEGLEHAGKVGSLMVRSLFKLSLTFYRSIEKALIRVSNFAVFLKALSNVIARIDSASCYRQLLQDIWTQKSTACKCVNLSTAV